MEYLTSDYWKGFIKEDKRFDGKKFEQLTKELLPILGISNLRETKKSWDRSRDFEDRNKKIWVECKMHEDSISIRVISPTLVMAIIDKPNTIYFFSYSPLNDNTIRHLAQFQNSTKMTIFVFDDTNLESLILSSKKTTKLFFPTFKYNEIKKEHLYNTLINFSKDPDIEYYGEIIDDPEKKELYIHSVFSIDIFIRNLNIVNDLTGLLTVDSHFSASNFILLNKSIKKNNYNLDVQIKRGSLLFYRYYFKVLECGKIKLPYFTFKINNSDEERVISLKYNTVNVSSIIKTPLIGKEYLESLRRFKNIAQARNQPVIFNLYGESGTGKSRMLKEYSETLLEEEFSILNFNGEDVREVGFKTFIQRIFSRVYKLPLITSIEDTNITPNNEFVQNLLYNPDIEIEKDLNQCIHYFLDGIIEHKTALIIDNLQNFDVPSLNFIDKLITQIEGTPLKFVLVFSFNTNYLYSGTEAFSVFERFKLKGNNDTFINDEIIGFDENAYNIYLDSCIKPLKEKSEDPFSLEYPETTKLFKEKVLNRPLFIEQTLLYLEQESAIKRIHDKFYVSNITKFHSILSHDFPKDLGELINKRWDIVKSRLSINNSTIKVQSIDKILMFLCYFNKIDLKHIIKFSKSSSSIYFLEQLGFLKIDEKEIVSFYHHQLFLFFRKQLRKYSQNDYQAYKVFLDENLLKDDFFYQYFILSERLNALNTNLIQKAIDKALSNFQYDDFLIPFTKSLFNTLKINKYELEESVILHSFKKLGRVIKIFDNLENGLIFLENANIIVLNKIEAFIKYGLPYVDFIHEIANACIAVNQDTKAIKIIEETISQKENLIFNNKNEKQICIAKLQNRLCVVYKALGLNEDALLAGDKSLKIAIKLKDHNLQLKNYIDIANIYRRKKQNKEKLIELWTKAIELYYKQKNIDSLISAQRSMVQLYEAQKYVLTNRFEEGIKLLKEGARYSEAHSDFFFGVKYLLIEIVSQISFNKPNINYSELILQLYKAKDLCVRYKVNRTYWKALYIEGVIYLLQDNNNIKKASESFLMSFEQFQLIINSVGIEEYYISYFLNLSYFFKMNIKEKLSEIYFNKIQLINSPEIKNRANEIKNMEMDTFMKLYNNHQPISLFNDGKFDFPVLG